MKFIPEIIDRKNKCSKHFIFAIENSKERERRKEFSLTYSSEHPHVGPILNPFAQTFCFGRRLDLHLRREPSKCHLFHLRGQGRELIGAPTAQETALAGLSLSHTHTVRERLVLTHTRACVNRKVKYSNELQHQIFHSNAK